MEKEILQKLIEQNAILCDIKNGIEKLSANIDRLETVKIIDEYSQSQRSHSGGWAGFAEGIGGNGWGQA